MRPDLMGDKVVPLRWQAVALLTFCYFFSDSVCMNRIIFKTGSVIGFWVSVAATGNMPKCF